MIYLSQRSNIFQMLEGAVARLLNQLLGKYVIDLDTENLNVGIFSGQVQLTDLKLKPEALVSIYLQCFPMNFFTYDFGRPIAATASTKRA